MVGTVTKIAISAIVFVVITVIAMLTDDTLFKESQTFIPKIQADTSDFTKSAWLFYTNYGLDLIIIAPILITYMFVGQRSRCFYYVFVTFGINGLSNMLKLIDH